MSHTQHGRPPGPARRPGRSPRVVAAAVTVTVTLAAVALLAWNRAWPPSGSGSDTVTTTGATTAADPSSTGAPRGGTSAADTPAGPASSGPVPATAARTVVVGTAPARRPATSGVPRAGAVTVAAVGDIACDPASSGFDGGLGSGTRCRHKAVADLVASRRPKAFLALGDIQYEDGTLAAFRASYDKAFGRLKPITHPVPGNHEYHTPGAAGYFDYFGARAGIRGKGWYSVDLGPWHVVALNANCGEVSCKPGSEQERWLRDDLARHRNRCTLAMWHQPRWSSGSEHGDSTSVAPLVRALYDGGVDVLLSGHDHDYERFAPQDPDGALDRARGVRQFVVGGGGKNLYRVSGGTNTEARNDTTFGALFLTLAPTSYSWRYVAAVGSYTDGGTTACH